MLIQQKKAGTAHNKLLHNR